jgi:outer membrane receptor for ferrienterochelin and colicins
LIQRVEVIRGPGSVLYGTNAFSGAINIITKTHNEFDGLLISQGFGSFQTYDSEGLFGGQYGDLNIIGSARMFDSNGWDFNATDGNNVTGTIDYGRQVRSGFFQADYQNLTLTGYTGFNEDDTIDFSTAFPNNTAHGRRRFLDAEYKTNISTTNWQAALNTTYNGYDGALSITGNPNISNRSSDDILFEAGIRGDLGQNINLSAGASVEHHQVDVQGVKFYNSLLSTGYGQIDYTPYDWLRLIAGGQINQSKGTRRDFSPRIASIVHLNSNWGLKLLHAKAYRSPQAIERKDLTPTLLGNPNLQSETIRTTDIQLFYNNQDIKGSVTYYKSKQKDTIARIPVTGAFQFNNEGSIDYEGIEVEGTYTPHASPWSLTGSLSWQSGKDENGNSDIGIVPHYMAKLGVTYAPINGGYSLGIFDSYYSKPTTISDAFPSVLNVNPPSKPTHMMTANASVHIPTFLDNENLPDITMNMFVDNVLGTDFDFPQYTSPRVNTLPSRSGRAFYARASVKF